LAVLEFCRALKAKEHKKLAGFTPTMNMLVFLLSQHLMNPFQVPVVDAGTDASRLLHFKNIPFGNGNRDVPDR